MTAPGSYMQMGVPGQDRRGPPIPQSEVQAQTYMWAQQQYMVDSGVHSGANTGAASMISGANSMHDDLIYGDPYTPGFSQEHAAEEINEQYAKTRSHRIRAAMFPETLDESGDSSAAMAAGQFDFGQSANVQRLAEPSQMLKTAVVNLINFQDDAEVATRAIPQLIGLLSDQDQVVVGHAAMMVHQLSKKDAQLRALVNNRELVQAVVKAMNNTKDANTIKYTAGTLYHMSQHEQGLLAIFQSGGIPALVRLLGSPIDSVVFYAITTLHNLLLHQEGAKQSVRVEGGIEKMVALLDKHIQKFLAILTDCLQILSYGHQESKLRILSAGGPDKLVQIMRRFSYEKLLWTTSRVLKVLSVCSQNKPALVSAGAMQALAVHLTHPSQRLVQNCLWTLRNLSDAATKEENMNELLLTLIRLLGSSAVETVTCCTGILSNLTCNNQRNKAFLCHNNGIEYLIRTLNNHKHNGEITEPGLCSLRHLTSRHPDAALAQNEVRSRDGIPLVVELLQSRQPLLVKAALGLVRNLAMCEANLHDLQPAVQLASVALMDSYGQVHNAHLTQQPMPVVDGVNVMEIVEVAVGALQMLAHHPQHRLEVRRDQRLVSIFVHLLSFDVESIQRVATGVLCEISKDSEGAQLIEQQPGAISQLTELVHSQHEAIRTYAAATLYNTGRDKPDEYRQSVEMGVSSALYRDDSAPWTRDGLDEMQGISGEPFADMMYQQASYDPSQQMGSPAGGWNDSSMDTTGYGGYAVPPGHPPPGQVGQGMSPAPQPPLQQQQPPSAGGGHVNAGWYDTDL